MIATIAVNARTRASHDSDAHDTLGISVERSSDPPHTAIAVAQMPATTASRTLSVSSWATSLARPTPSARRTANSRRRASARESSRLATFAHAMRSTIAAPPSSRVAMGTLVGV